MSVDPWILTFSAITVLATIAMGFWSARKSKTASDFFVAGRSVSVGWNASAISGEYLSAASFMGVAGMVMSSGYDALWYPVCYACGYLFLLLFIAGPLRRFGAYTIPDFAEGRYDSPIFRKIAVIFVMFIGFFYTMPQMKGAGTTLAYIFPGLPYWVGVALVGAVITLNVALGGMKGITLVQAFQYWAKMFAISVPIFVLMSVYGHYGKQLGVNAGYAASRVQAQQHPDFLTNFVSYTVNNRRKFKEIQTTLQNDNPIKDKAKTMADWLSDAPTVDCMERRTVIQAIGQYNAATRHTVWVANNLTNSWMMNAKTNPAYGKKQTLPQQQRAAEEFLDKEGISLVQLPGNEVAATPKGDKARYIGLIASWSSASELRKPLLEKVPLQFTEVKGTPKPEIKSLNSLKHRVRVEKWAREKNYLPNANSDWEIYGLLAHISSYEGQTFLLANELVHKKVSFGFTNNISEYEFIDLMKAALVSNNIVLIPESEQIVRVVPAEFTAAYKNVSTVIRKPLPDKAPKDETWISPFGPLTSKAVKAAAAKLPDIEQKAYLEKHQKQFSLLYTYSLIIALVCGTAGLPHILVRFYTNPDGVAAKRTTMWVMILIGIFYVFPPVFGVMGRNLMPELYNGLAGVKGTDGVVLKLPRILNDRGAHAAGVQSAAARSGLRSTGSGLRSTGSGLRSSDLKLEERESGGPPDSAGGPPALPIKKGIPWGSILSGVTCAGAFAAFMSTFSGLLVSMTGALAHDVYGRIFRPKSTPEQRMRMFKVCAVICGAGAILLGLFVEKFEINKMVGWAFAIAAASYFPLLFMSVWWRGMTMRGAATGMLVGGMASLITVVSTMLADQAEWAKPLSEFFATHPLIRILCEQPAIWAVPLSITLMIVISKLTRKEIPSDVRMKMLVLHAPEKLGLKQEYIQEHQAMH